MNSSTQGSDLTLFGLPAERGRWVSDSLGNACLTLFGDGLFLEYF